MKKIITIVLTAIVLMSCIKREELFYFEDEIQGEYSLTFNSLPEFEGSVGEWVIITSTMINFQESDNHYNYEVEEDYVISYEGKTYKVDLLDGYLTLTRENKILYLTKIE